MAAKQVNVKVNQIEVLLDPYQSWKLDRLSPTSAPCDVVVRSRMSEAEFKEIEKLMSGGNCFRCRISKGPYYYADNPIRAIELAIEAHPRK